MTAESIAVVIVYLPPIFPDTYTNKTLVIITGQESRAKRRSSYLSSRIDWDGSDGENT